MRLRHVFDVDYPPAPEPMAEREGALNLFALPSAIPIGDAVRVAVESGDAGTGFHEHRGENRSQRLREAATFTPPEGDITRRDMVRQRQRRARGKLDVETRRLQRKALGR